MTVAEEPEHVYGTRKRKNGLPHEQWVYSKIWRLTQQGENALAISQDNDGELGMTADKVARVMDKQRERGKPFPEAYGRPLGSGKFTMSTTISSTNGCWKPALERRSRTWPTRS